jgi:lipopolysaccharide/colanic/teichoic acid biosynthesis glycosyltransferase
MLRNVPHLDPSTANAESLSVTPLTARESTGHTALLDLLADGPMPEGYRRALNVTVAVVGLIVTMPAMILIAIAIKLTSKGPVFYSQSRVGFDNRKIRRDPDDDSHRRSSDLGGRPFLILKFRTMQTNAELRTGAVWAAKNDPRVTTVGRFLRQFRLDELPQLINVLRGDMNVVGPRPERPVIYRRLRAQLGPQYQLRQRVRPGITGLAQINQHYDTSIDDVRRKLAFDLQYVSRASWWEDTKIMVKTIPAVLFRRGGW